MIPLGLVRLSPKNGGLCGCNVNKSFFLGQKWALAPTPEPAVQHCQHKQVVFVVFCHDGVFNTW